MNGKKAVIISAVILLLAIVATVGASYAYFATVNKTSGNDRNLNIVTEDLGNIKWEGTKVYTSGDLLPGECGIQTFTIEKNSTSGKGIYEIDLKGILDESFGTDVEITLYKSTDTATNNVTIKEGNSTISGDTTKEYYKEDSVVLNGTPEKVYGKALQNKDKIILEQRDFDNSTLEKTTYYLVYCYKNADYSQDAQQGKSFSGEISVKLILEKITKLNEYVENVASDTRQDEAGNVRYIGADPNNYVSFDGDIWRIIGTMKDIDDGTGNKSDRVKLIRASSIGSYSWDTSDESVNYGLGVNEWSQADLMKLLNPRHESESVGGSLYWNSGAGTCYSSSRNRTTACDFTSTGIKDKLKTLISDAVWNTGAPKTLNEMVSKIYIEERGNGNGKICSSGYLCDDTVERTTTWKGKVGLVYPSDFGYATSDYRNNWLLSENTQWTLTPMQDLESASRVYSVFSKYKLYETLARPVVAILCDNNDCSSDSNAVYPSVYLLSSVKIVSGDGSETNPFELSL